MQNGSDLSNYMFIAFNKNTCMTDLRRSEACNSTYEMVYLHLFLKRLSKFHLTTYTNNYSLET